MSAARADSHIRMRMGVSKCERESIMMNGMQMSVCAAE